jgi:CHAT domain-containing protein/tetratricopeptide (TPR) repeat protein
VSLLMSRCGPVGAGDELNVQITAPADGVVRIDIRQRGLSVVGHLRDGSAEHAVSSPIDRVGSITLVQQALRSGQITLRVVSRDAPAIRAEACVSVESLAQASSIRLRAERTTQAAEEATYRRDWQAAFDDYALAARILDGLNRPRQAASARHAMAQIAYDDLRRKRDSYALAAAAVAGAQDDESVTGARLVLLAKALLELPASDAGVALGVRQRLESAAQLFHSPRDRRELPRLWNLEGFLQYQSDRPNESYRLFEAAAAECRRLGDLECFARSRQNMAALAEEQQSYSAALSDYEDALRALDGSVYPELTADASGNLGRLQAKVGLFSGSEESQRAAMRLYGLVGDCEGARLSARSLGGLLLQVGSLDDAVGYLQEVVSFDCHRLLAAVRKPTALKLTAQPQTASEGEQQPVPCRRRPQLGELNADADITVFHGLLDLSDLAVLTGELDRAHSCLALARPYAIDARTQILLANADGNLLLDERSPAAARAAFAHAIGIADGAALGPTVEYRAVAELGMAQSALLQGLADDAQRHASVALAQSSARADLSQVVASLRVLAAGYDLAHRETEAVRILRLAVRLIEQVPTDGLDAERRATFLATQHAVFAELTGLLLREHPQGAVLDDSRIWDAFSVAEEGRARSARYALDPLTAGNTPATFDADARRYRELLSRISSLTDPVGAAGRDAMLDAMSRMRLDEQRTALPLDRDALTRHLGSSGTTLVEYATGAREAFAFVIDESHVRLVRLGDRDAIAQTATDLLEQLRAAEPIPARIRTAAQRLAELTLWPLSPYLGSSLVFVPDDALHTVPFALLPWSRERPEELLVQHAESSVEPSALLFERPQRQEEALSPAQPPRFVLIGDPVFNRTAWRRECLGNDAPTPQRDEDPAGEWTQLLPRLTGSRAEVDSVAALLRQARPASRIATLLECQATAAALRSDAPDALLLHVATHGLVDARRPRLSALALTRGREPGDEGAFRLLDIVQLKLRAHLVVLSACDTSRGRLLPGEGVLGLAQAFLQAGAASVVATYWRVEDEATEPLMRRFYQHLLLDRTTASAALRRAQLEERQADQGSYSWAAFSLYGRADSTL